MSRVFNSKKLSLSEVWMVGADPCARPCCIYQNTRVNVRGALGYGARYHYKDNMFIATVSYRISS